MTEPHATQFLTARAAEPTTAIVVVSGEWIRRSLLAIVAAVVVSGCARDIETTYGRRQGSGGDSVNGTRVLARMFEYAGHDVHSWSVLSPTLREADVIVWAPDAFELPTPEVQMWLADWLTGGQGERTLIYIGRDYDAAPAYWSYVKSTAPVEQQAEAARRFNQSQSELDGQRKLLTGEDEWPGYFTIDFDAQPSRVTTLSGPWSRAIDASQVEIESNSRIVPAEPSDVLLSTGEGVPLASELVIGAEVSRNTRDMTNSRLIVVQNGSFLLNLPLVNHEHRKLAGRLIEHVGPPRQRVVFLESTSGGPPVRDSDPQDGPPSGLALLLIWPIGGVLVHVAALGLVYAVSRWPIFGVPRQLPRVSLTDFGAHVTALGKLLQATGDTNYAREILVEYRHVVHGEGEGAAASESDATQELTKLVVEPPPHAG